MKTEIHRFSLRESCAYLIKEDGLILIDAGSANQAEKFTKELKNLSIEPKDIRLILLTHGHHDHYGSANEIKSLTGAKIAVNQHDKDMVEKGVIQKLHAFNLWGKLRMKIIVMRASKMSISGVPVDLVLEDNDFSLEPYGIHGKAILTPGHSSGSMSVLLDTGDVFVGDLAVNAFFFRIGPGLPLWGEDMGTMRKSLRLLLDKGAKWIYPAHGKPFKAEKLRKFL